MQSRYLIAAALCATGMACTTPALASPQHVSTSHMPTSAEPQDSTWPSLFPNLAHYTAHPQFSLNTAPIALSLMQDHAHDHDHSHGDEMQHLAPALGANIFQGWLDPWQHSDYSRLGSPFVHLFFSEPAYIDQGLHLDFAFATGDEGDEYEIEAEIEFGLTRRIGLVIEAPYAFLDPDEGESENGFGDVAVAPRFLLLDYDRFLMSANVEFEFPTGDEDRGLGAGETVFTPSLSMWLDLGHNFSVQGNAGWEHGFSSGDDAFVWGAAFTYTMYLREAEIISADGAVRSHFPVGMLSLIAELRGEHPLDGPDEGTSTATAVLGASYTFAPLLELRAGFTFAPWKPREFDVGAIVGMIYHF